jgi:hypothetical protein
LAPTGTNPGLDPAIPTIRPNFRDRYPELPFAGIGANFGTRSIAQDGAPVHSRTDRASTVRYPDGTRMKDDNDGRDGQAGRATRDSRQQRLKLALRENLKRRKSQARGRGDPAAAPSEDPRGSLDSPGEKKLGR